jgi:hypothetical protein
VLKGLVRYSAMLNIEIVLDLVKNLIELLKTEKVKGDNRFHCIYSCVKIISTTQHVLRFEDKDLTKILYAAILETPVEKPSQRLLVQSLTWLLIESKQYSFDLVAAFLKRIIQSAVKCELDLMKALLCLIKQVMVKFPKAYQLMESDDSTDSYLATIADPYLAQASTSSLLPEIEILKKVKDSQLQSIIKSLSKRMPYDKKPLDFLYLPF